MGNFRVILFFIWFVFTPMMVFGQSTFVSSSELQDNLTQTFKDFESTRNVTKGTILSDRLQLVYEEYQRRLEERFEIEEHVKGLELLEKTYQQPFVLDDTVLNFLHYPEKRNVSEIETKLNDILELNPSNFDPDLFEFSREDKPFYQTFFSSLPPLNSVFQEENAERARIELLPQGDLIYERIQRVVNDPEFRNLQGKERLSYFMETYLLTSLDKVIVIGPNQIQDPILSRDVEVWREFFNSYLPNVASKDLFVQGGDPLVISRKVLTFYREYLWPYLVTYRKMTLEKRLLYSQIEAFKQVHSSLMSRDRLYVTILEGYFKKDLDYAETQYKPYVPLEAFFSSYSVDSAPSADDALVAVSSIITELHTMKKSIDFKSIKRPHYSHWIPNNEIQTDYSFVEVKSDFSFRIVNLLRGEAIQKDFSDWDEIEFEKKSTEKIKNRLEEAKKKISDRLKVNNSLYNQIVTLYNGPFFGDSYKALSGVQAVGVEDIDKRLLSKKEEAKESLEAFRQELYRNKMVLEGYVFHDQALLDRLQEQIVFIKQFENVQSHFLASVTGLYNHYRSIKTFEPDFETVDSFETELDRWFDLTNEFILACQNSFSFHKLQWPFAKDDVSNDMFYPFFIDDSYQSFASERLADEMKMFREKMKERLKSFSLLWSPDDLSTYQYPLYENRSILVSTQQIQDDRAAFNKDMESLISFSKHELEQATDLETEWRSVIGSLDAFESHFYRQYPALMTYDFSENLAEFKSKEGLEMKHVADQKKILIDNLEALKSRLAYQRGQARIVDEREEALSRVTSSKMRLAHIQLASAFVADMVRELDQTLTYMPRIASINPSKGALLYYYFTAKQERLEENLELAFDYFSGGFSENDEVAAKIALEDLIKKTFVFKASYRTLKSELRLYIVDLSQMEVQSQFLDDDVRLESILFGYQDSDLDGLDDISEIMSTNSPIGL